MPFPQHVTYSSGSILPNHVSQTQRDVGVQTFYDQWKARYMVNGCTGNDYYVNYNLEGAGYPANAITVSEAHGYGMMIAALMAGYDSQAKTVFDGMYNYWKKHPSAYNSYLMSWQQGTGCVDISGNDAATDGDLDIAYALLLADKQWGSAGAVNYLTEAVKVINAIMQDEINQSTFHTLLGDWAGSGGYSNSTRTSDFLLNHFRSFEKASGDSKWNNVLNTCYSLIGNIQTNYSASTGLLPDFIVNVSGGGAPASPYFLESDNDGNYYYNACRDPWRIATDYLLSGDTRASTACGKLNSWIKTKTSNTPANILAGYTLSGGNVAGNGYASQAFIAPFMVGAMVESANQSWLNSLWSQVISSDIAWEGYYENTIKMLCLIVASGNWWDPTAGGNNPPTVAITAPADNAAACSLGGFLITADASDADGSVTKVVFYQGTTLLGEDMTAPYSYSWTGISSGVYSISAIATDDMGLSAQSAAVSVVVNALPTADAGSDQSVCAGMPVALVAKGGDSYLWNTGNTEATIQVAPGTATNYTVTVSSKGCTNTDAVTVNVFSLPVAVVNDVTICQEVNFTLMASGGTAYHWSTGESLSAITASAGTTTTYTVTVTNGDGCTDTEDAVVTVTPLPLAGAGPDQSICEGSEVALTASGGDTYIWSGGSTDVSINVSPLITTTYTVTVDINDDCAAATDEVVVSINTGITANAGADMVVCIGSNGMLTATGGSVFSWNTGETTAQLAISPNISTTYTVTVSTSDGCDNGVDDVVVSVHELPTAEAGPDIYICLGDTATLTAAGGVTYRWSNGSTNPSLQVNPATTTPFTVTVVDVNGCEDTAEQMVLLYPVPIVSAGQDAVVCSGKPIALEASGGISFLWNTGSTEQTIVVAPDAEATYTVKGTNSNACTATDEVVVTISTMPTANAGADVSVCSSGTTLTASGGNTYAWSTGETTASIDVTIGFTSTYTVSVFDAGGCFDTDEVVVIKEGASSPVWDFVADEEGWTHVEGLTNAVSNGIWTIGTKKKGKPQTITLLSPEQLCVDASLAQELVINMKNTTESTSAIIRWITEEDPWFDSKKQITITINANDGSFTDYLIPVSNNLNWFGTVKQLQVVPATRVRSGDVQIDYIHISTTVAIAEPALPTVTADAPQMCIYPNPLSAGNFAYIKQKAIVGSATVVMTDLSGRVVYTSRVNVASESTRFELNAPIGKGIYLVHLIGKEASVSGKLIVQPFD